MVSSLQTTCGLVVRLPLYRSRGPGFDSRRYQIFWVAGLEWGPLSLVSTIEELLGRNSSGFSLEIREYGHGDLLHWPRDTLYPQRLALTSLRSGGRSVGTVRSRTEAKKLSLFLVYSDFMTTISCALKIQLHILVGSVNYAMYTSPVIIIPLLYCHQTASAATSMAFCRRRRGQGGRHPSGHTAWNQNFQRWVLVYCWNGFQ
jgi:hypothetical protein